MKKRMLKCSLFVYAIIFISSCSVFIPGNLGNNLYLMKGDGYDEDIIVLCSGKDLLGCFSGACIIPPKKLELNKDLEVDRRYYMEHVIEVESNKKCVLAKTYNAYDQKTNYWLINKDFNAENIQAETIISTYLTGPLDSVQFYQELKSRNIDLRFE